jgi:hypothetical protein
MTKQTRTVMTLVGGAALTTGPATAATSTGVGAHRTAAVDQGGHHEAPRRPRTRRSRPVDRRSQVAPSRPDMSLRTQVIIPTVR